MISLCLQDVSCIDHMTKMVVVDWLTDGSVCKHALSTQHTSSKVQKQKMPNKINNENLNRNGSSKGCIINLFTRKFLFVIFIVLYNLPFFLSSHT